MAVPIAVRGLATAGALAILALVIVPGAGLITDAPIQAAGALLAGVPFAALLAWIAVTPGHANDHLGRIGVDLADARDALGLSIHLAFAWLVFAGTALETSRALSELMATGVHPAETQQLGGTGIVANLLLSLILFVLAATTWLWLVDDLDLSAMVSQLRLELGGLLRGIVWGVGATIAGFVILAGLGYAIQQLGIQPDNPQADAIANALTPATAVAVAALAGMGEEFYFRGFLLDRVGNFTQATLFALLHATYLTAFQVILPFALGLAFGWLVRKTNLWTAIVSHTLFNAVMLVTSIYADELAALAPL